MNIEDHIRQMKVLADRLTPHSFPQVSPVDEATLTVLKQRQIVVDGYDLIVYLNRCRHLDVDIEMLQIFGKYFTFLPFSLVCGVAGKFLGVTELSLMNITHGSGEQKRRIHVWSVFYRDGKVVPNPFVHRFNYRTFGDIKFNLVQNF